MLFLRGVDRVDAGVGELVAAGRVVGVEYVALRFHGVRFGARMDYVQAGVRLDDDCGVSPRLLGMRSDAIRAALSCASSDRESYPNR